MKSSSSKISKTLLDEGRKYSERILKGLTSGVSHFHAVKYMKDELKSNGFLEIREVDKWENLAPGKSYYFTRNTSTIVAFTLGSKCT